MDEQPHAPAAEQGEQQAETQAPPKPIGDAVAALAALVGAVANRGDPRACGVEAGRCEEAFGKLGGSFRLQFVPPAVFCDGDLALVPPASLTELKQLQAALDVAGIGVVESQSPLAGEHWLGFAAGVVAAARGNRDALAQAPTGPLHFGRHPSARAGGAGELSAGGRVGTMYCGYRCDAGGGHGAG